MAQISVNNLSFSYERQKKKVLIAASLLTPAHLYIWKIATKIIEL